MNRIGCIFILNFALFSYAQAEQVNQNKQSTIPTTQKTASMDLRLDWLVEAQNIQKENGVVFKIPKAHYQLDIPFMDYDNTDEKRVPYKHYLMLDKYQYDLHCSSVPSNMSDKAGNTLIKWLGINSDVSVTAIPVLDPSAEQLPASQSENDYVPNTLFRVTQPIIMHKNNRLFARIDSMQMVETRKKENGFLDVTLTGTFDKLTMADIRKTYGPGEFTVVISNLDASSADVMEHDLKNPDPEKRTLALQNIMVQIPALFSKGARFKYNLSMKTPSGNLDYEYSVDLSILMIRSFNVKKLIPAMLSASSAANNTQKPSLMLPFIDDLAGHASIHISKQDLEDWMQILSSERLQYQSLKNPGHFITAGQNTYIRDIVAAGLKHGILSVHGQQYTFDFDFDQGKQSNQTDLFFLASDK